MQSSQAIGSKNIKKSIPLEDDNKSDQLKKFKEKGELALTMKKTTLDATAESFWDVESTLKTAVIDDSHTMQQLTIAEGGVNYSARRYNDLRVYCQKLSRELKVKLDDLDEMKKTYEGLDALKKSQTDEGQRILHLQREVNQVEEDIAKKVHYTRQLVHILERLKRNQIKYDAHMSGMEETVKNLEKETIEVRMLRNSLDASLSKAMTIFERTQGNLTTARKERDVMLEQRKVEVKNAWSLQEWMKKRVDAKIALALELQGDLTKEEEMFLRDQISEKVEKTRHLQRATEESQRKLQAMEDAFTKLKQVTAVSSLNEMHEKFSQQRTNKKQLEFEVKEAESRLLKVKRQYAKKEEIYQELKSSGGGVAELSRESIQKLENGIEISRNEYRFVYATLDRLSSIQLGLNQGSRGLLQRVQPFLSLADGGVFELTQTDEDIPWADTLEALSTAEQVLAKMLDTINGEVGIGNGGSNDDENEDVDDEDESASRVSTQRLAESFESIEDIPALANNIRIKSNKILREMEYGNTWGGGLAAATGLGTVGEEALADGTALNSDGKGDNDSDIDFNDNTGTGAGTMSGAALNSDPLNPADPLNILTRATVKKSSVLLLNEARKKSELEIKRKRLQDRMKGVGGQDDVGGIATIAKLKAQKAMADRLSTIKTSFALPDGVAVNDNVMTKTNAFLTKLPDLQ